jgi:arylsulfatase
VLPHPLLPADRPQPHPQQHGLHHRGRHRLPQAIAGSGLCVGQDPGEPITQDYPGEPPYRFTGGVIDRVAIDVSGEPYHDLEREAALMLMRE